ncbi:hypothetical protein OKW76_07080 [Sphingomonas sp. S1-29]|uniref:hypothetical protein n=1 Tax=Sphingomonas sp. S1-29 TaxID=2991074 RepID=UPI002240D733|nr:hypothetical protein [Sphingomonas sp. S1-29]UZK70778.1 hypothetical protein OKW76_07080 [Sphingomonas sp. S1-29]
MKKMGFAWAIALVSANGAANAQEMRELVTPSKGIKSTATVGSNVYVHQKYRAAKSYRIDEPVKAKILFAQVDLPAGTQLMRIDSKAKLKACASPTMEAFAKKYYVGCLMDDDGNGTFDRVAGNEVQSGKKLPKPLPYIESEYIDGAPGSLKQVLIYLGSTKDTLRLSYREFVDDMARPAFTEEYTFPLGTQFPQPVAFKDVKLTITGIDGAGMHYVVD